MDEIDVHEIEKTAFIEAFKIGFRVAEGLMKITDFELDENLNHESLAHFWGWKKDSGFNPGRGISSSEWQ